MASSSLDIILNAVDRTAGGIASVRSGINSLVRSVTSVKGLVVGALSAVGIGLSVNAIKDWVGGAMDAIDVTGKLAKSLGATTEGLVGLQYAADLAGVSSEQLAGSMQKMLKSLGGVSEDGVNIGGIFTKIGLDAQKLKGMAADEAFIEIAGAINSLRTPTERVTAATKIFGREGARLLPLFSEGAEGIRIAQREIIAMGGAFSAMDFEKVQKANDEMTRMGWVVKGIGRTLAIQIAPFVDALSVKLRTMATEGTGLATKVVAGFESMLKAAGTFADALQLIIAGWQTLRGIAAVAASIFIDAITETIRAQSVLAALLGKDTSSYDAAMKRTDSMSAAFDSTADDAKIAANKAWSAWSNKTNSKAATALFDEIKKAADEAAAALAAAGKKTNEFNVKWIVNAANSVVGQATTMGEAIAEAGRKGWGAFQKHMDKNKESIKDILDDLQRKLDTFGMTEIQKAIFDVQAKGGTDADIERVLSLADQLEGLGFGERKIKDKVTGGRELAPTENARFLTGVGALGGDPMQKEAVSLARKAAQDRRQLKDDTREIRDLFRRIITGDIIVGI